MDAAGGHRIPIFKSGSADSREPVSGLFRCKMNETGRRTLPFWHTPPCPSDRMSDQVPQVLYASPVPGSTGRFRNRYLTVLCSVFAIIWAIACVRPESQVNWWTE